MYWSKLDMNLPVGDRCSVINLISWFEKNRTRVVRQGLRFDLKWIPQSLREAS